MRGLAYIKPTVIFDTGAEANFTFAGLWHRTDTYEIGSITIQSVTTRNCNPINVSPAFGLSNVIGKQIKLKITIQNKYTFFDWFYILPQKKSAIFIGKPLLRKLRYSLTPESEHVEIQGKRLYLQSLPEISATATSLFKIDHVNIAQDLKTKYPSTFSNEFSLALKHKYKAHVTLKDFPYTTPKAYFSGSSQRTAIKQYIDQSLENGLIVPIQSDELVALSPVFPLQQKTDKIRIITDLRKVNKHLQYTPRPIPTTLSILSDLSSKKVFSAIDIRKAYQQLPLSGDSLGIITEYGSFKFTRLPYGLASAPYWWGEFIQGIIRTLRIPNDVTIRYYYDDIIIATTSVTEHYKVLNCLFKALQKNGLSVSEEKLQLAVPKVLFLGYEISHNRLALDPEKINSINNWSLPTTKEGIMKFIGFVNYLRNFIPDTSNLLLPFYHIIDSKVHDRIPSPKYIEQHTLKSFQRIKYWVSKSIRLKLFDPQSPSILYTDASKTGAAAVLFQYEIKDGKKMIFPLSFFSLRFTTTQQNYSTVERELFAVLHTLEHARLLLSPEITIYTDNQGIISIGNTNRQTHPRFAKFLDLLNVYRLKWKYLPGTKNVLADYLSRFGLDSQPVLDLQHWDEVATDVSLDHPSINAITTAENPVGRPQRGRSLSEPPLPVQHTDISNVDDPNVQNTNTSVDHPKISPPDIQELQPLENNHRTTPLPLQDDALLEEDNNTVDNNDTDPVIRDINALSWPDILLIKQLLVEHSDDIPERISELIQFFHVIDDILYTLHGHTLRRVIVDFDYLRLAKKYHYRFHSSHRVLQLMLDEDNYWNPNSKLLTLDVIRTCHHCDVYQKFRDLQPELPSLQPTPVFTRWHLDFAGPFPRSNDCSYILIAADYTSNLVLVQPVDAQTTDVVISMLQTIFSIFGKPHTIVADNGAPLNNGFLDEFTKRAHIRMKHSSAYHPRGNSKAERSVQLVKTILKHITPNMTAWDTHVYWAAEIVNNTKMMYGYSPREIAFGKKSHKFADNIAAILRKVLIDGTFTDHLDREENVHLAMLNHKVLRKARDTNYDNKVKIREALQRTRLNTENKVPYTKGDFVYRLRVKKNKFEPTWDGPYTVYAKVGKNTYKLLNEDNTLRKNTYEASKLKPAYSYYGTPLRYAAEYTKVYADKERQYYIQTLEDAARFAQQY